MQLSLQAPIDHKIQYLHIGQRKENIINGLHSLLMIEGYYEL
jgi:hypothetical protein